MLRPIQIDLAIFESKEPDDLDRSRKSILCMMLGLSLANLEFLKFARNRGTKIPKLYDSGILYQAEDGTENWQDIPHLLRKGYGDCEDLACFRVAEHMLNGVRALPYVTWRTEGKTRTILHAVVQLPDGRIEDPSRALGMSGDPTFRPVYITADDLRSV